MPHCKEIKLGDVWRTCNKIRAAVFRMGINLFDYFTPLDRHNNCLISESQFISVINGQLRAIIGLSEQEVAELADYFRVPDGRIYYTQLCEVIHNSVPQFSENAPLVTGLEWEDPLHTNRLSISEERRLSILMTKIASLVNFRKIILRPYFQDYELVSKNNGTISVAHFARILAYLEILLSADDFNLLVKKFIKDSYSVNYNAFIFSIDQIINYLNSHGIVDLCGDLMDLFPGKVISAELPKLPRPEIVRHLWNLTWKKLRQQIIECYVLFRFSISSTSSEHSDSEFSIASVLKDGLDSKRLTELPLNDKIVPEEQVQYCIPKTESSTTLTASEAEHLLEENVSGEQQACHSKSEIKRNLATLRPVRCASWP